MIEIADNKPQEILKKQAVVYNHLCDIFDKYYREMYGDKQDGVVVKLKFFDIFREFLRIAQLDGGRYLDDYYQRLIRKEV